MRRLCVLALLYVAAAASADTPAATQVAAETNRRLRGASVPAEAKPLPAEAKPLPDDVTPAHRHLIFGYLRTHFDDDDDAATDSTDKLPSVLNTETPTAQPTTAKKEPTDAPVKQEPVTEEPTVVPTAKEPDTKEPTETPSSQPTTDEPTKTPTKETRTPTKEPTHVPTSSQPTTDEPTDTPTKEATHVPTKEPTDTPSNEPTREPTAAETCPQSVVEQALLKAAPGVLVEEYGGSGSLSGFLSARLGHAVAADGNLVVAGAPEDGGGCASVYPPICNAVNPLYRSGAAIVWDFTLGLQYTLKEYEEDRKSGFGSAVAVAGNMVAVSAISIIDRTFPDKVHIFRQGDGFTFDEEQTLTGGSINTNFGIALAAADGLLVVGASRFSDRTTGNRPIAIGTAWVYRFNETLAEPWVVEKQLFCAGCDDPTNPIPVRANSLFGLAVAVSRDAQLIAVGARNKKFPQSSGSGYIQSGAAYVYRYQGGAWPEEEIRGDVPFGGFGGAVAITSDRLLAVGAPSVTSELGRSVGLVAVYGYNSSWARTATLLPDKPFEYLKFGNVVAAASGPICDTIVVGTERTIGISGVADRAYVFQNLEGNWTLIAKTNETFPPSNTGHSVAITSEGAIAVGLEDDGILVNSDSTSGPSTFLGEGVNSSGTVQLLSLA